MAEPRSFTVNRIVVPGLIMVLLGLVTLLSGPQRAEEDEALALMWEGCRTVFSGVLVAFPGLQRLLKERSDRVKR